LSFIVSQTKKIVGFRHYSKDASLCHTEKEWLLENSIEKQVVILSATKDLPATLLLEAI
jgi:hypothetical protein